MTDLLRGTRGLIVGMSGASSVGYHCAAAFTRMGAEVAITSRPGRMQACASLASEAGCALHLAMDPADDSSISAVLARLEQQWGGLDFVLHTLIQVPTGALNRPLTTLPRQELGQIFDSAVASLIAVTREAAPLLAASPAGRVVTLTSAGGERVLPNYHAVGITKAALIAALRYLADELGPRGVLCNAISFSLLPTEAAAAKIGAATAEHTHGYLAARASTAKALTYEQVASATAFLLSPACDNITGEVLTVDGGFSRTYLPAPRTTDGSAPLG